MKYILETNQLAKKYRQTEVLNGVNIHIEKGAIYGLIGKNGAGKTTLIRIICGLQSPTRGTYFIYGIQNERREIIKSRSRMGAIIEVPSIYQNLSAEDNLIEQYKIVGNPSTEDIKDLLKLVGLEHTGSKKAKNFSLGMKQRLGIAIALAANPDFLILDEPINGLDPEGIIEMRELILKLNREKRITILISSHYLDELSKIATHYGFLDGGRIVKEIRREELSKKMEHKIEMKTREPKRFVSYFEQKSISYEITAKDTINIYGKHNLSKLIADLAKKDLVADEIRETEESLENYYINLIGGSKNE